MPPWIDWKLLLCLCFYIFFCANCCGLRQDLVASDIQVRCIVARLWSLLSNLVVSSSVLLWQLGQVLGSGGRVSIGAHNSIGTANIEKEWGLWTFFGAAEKVSCTLFALSLFIAIWNSQLLCISIKESWDSIPLRCWLCKWNLIDICPNKNI